MNLVFDSVAEGGTENHVNFPEFTTHHIGSISNFGYGDSIGVGGASAVVMTDNGDGSFQIQADPPFGQVISSNVTLEPGTDPSDFQFVNGSFTYTGAFPCFAAGARILTERGEVAVEDLQAGDRVVTATGESRAVRWIGRTKLRTASGGDVDVVSPILIAKDAFGEGLPHRDLYLSRGHCIAWNNVLIPAESLLNGKTIVPEVRESIIYYHVELDEHDVLLAEGLPCESYLDTGNRLAFVNGQAFREFPVAPRHWSQTCLPHMKRGPEVEQTKALLLERAALFGARITTEPDLRIVADGERIEPTRVGGGRYAFAIPSDRRSIALRSRTFIPGETLAHSQDRRILGVNVTRLELDGEVQRLEAPFGEGWNAVERNEYGAFRWTGGGARLPAGSRAVLVDLGVAGYYWEDEAPALASLIA